jgi:cytochrome P450
VSRVDLPILDPQFRANPHALYDELRRTGRSVVPVRLPTGVEAWLVLGHAAARQLLNDPRLAKEAARRPPHAIFHHLLTMDPPDHTRLRAIVAKEFSPRRIRGLRPAIETIAGGLLDDLTRYEEADLIESFALPLPLTVICELLAIPRSDEPRVRDWSARLLDADLEHPDRVPQIAQELHGYFVSLAQAKRDTPDAGLFSALVDTSDRGELSEMELTAMGFLLLVAGHETTVNLIANGVLALLRHPPAWRALCADAGLAAAAVEELLRYDSPLEVATPRTAVSDFSVDGVRIRAGETVFVGLGAANRDDDAFTDPARLDLHRRNAGEHLAFGHGIHFCLGAALARLEGEVALTALVRRFPGLALAVPAEELRWKPGLIMRGLERLPVSLR